MVFNKSSHSVAEEAVLRIVDCSSQRYTTLQPMRAPKKDDWRVARAKDILLARLNENVSLGEIASEVGLSKLALLRMFAKATGFPPITWQRAKRIELARQLLKTGIPSADTAYQSGFADQAHLTRWFGRAYGISPAQFARR